MRKNSWFNEQITEPDLMEFLDVVALWNNM